ETPDGSPSDADEEVDYESYVDGMPCDPTLLEDPGRVNWAAARLHFAIRDAINALDGETSDAPFDVTLGKALTKLRERADAMISPEGRELSRWCRGPARKAVQARNGVIHAVTFTADDGRQAIGTVDHADPGDSLQLICDAWRAC
ncbi:MAG: hypothetical protein ABWX84_14675, partial [Nocardioides sp.]